MKYVKYVQIRLQVDHVLRMPKVDSAMLW